MPKKHLIKPLIKLTAEQINVVKARLFEKYGKLTQQAAGAMMKLEPPITEEVGALYKDVPMGAGEVTRNIERLPIEQARAKYLAAPESYTTPRMGAPQAKVISQPPGIEEAGVAGPEELAQKVSYKRVKEVPLLPPKPHTQKIIEQELADQDIIRQMKLEPEDIRPGVKPATVYEEKYGRAPEPTLPHTAMLAAYANKADDLWMVMGGGRSWAAKAFSMWRESSRQAPHIKTTRDYFISCYTKYCDDPAKFAKSHPREAGAFKKLEQELADQFATAIPGTNPPGTAGGGVAIAEPVTPTILRKAK